MALQETLFPLTISKWAASETYNTTITVGASGFEYRNANWQDPLRSYNAGFAVTTKAEAETLSAFFHTVRGRETAFLVKDYLDFSVDDWTEVAETVTGASQSFQLYKHYENALATSYDRNIIKVDGSTVRLRYNGAEKTYVASSPTAETEFTVNDTTGIITYDPPGTGTVDFKVVEYYVPVRFDVDTLPAMELFIYYLDAANHEKALLNIPDIPMVEVRL